MNRTALIAAVARRTDNSQIAVAQTFHVALDEITSTLAVGEAVEWFELGTFTKRVKPARQGRNPRTGEAITIPAREVVVFTPSAAFKRAATTPE